MSNGGIRPPEYLRDRVLNDLEDWMAQGLPWSKCMERLVERGYTDSEDTAKKWRLAIYKRWAADDQANRPARRDLWRARLERQYHELHERSLTKLSDHAYAALHAEMTRVAKVAIVLDQLTQPTSTSADGKTPWAAMSPMERDREIAALLAKRDASAKITPKDN